MTDNKPQVKPLASLGRIDSWPLEKKILSGFLLLIFIPFAFFSCALMALLGWDRHFDPKFLFLIMPLSISGMALSVCIASFLSKWFARPFQQCVERIESLEEGLGYEGGSESAFLAGRLERYIQDCHDADSRLQNEMHLREQGEKILKIYQAAFEGAMEGFIILDPQENILVSNKAAADLIGYRKEELAGQSINMLRSDRHPARFYDERWRQIEEQEHWQGETWVRKKDGHSYQFWQSINSIADADQTISLYFVAFREITERKKRERQLAFMASHDLLTGLPNRVSLEKRLESSIAGLGGQENNLALFLINIDNFKNINEAFGHQKGDQLLVQVTQQIGSILHGGGILYRFGGDEFVLLLEQVQNESVVYLMASRILRTMKRAFVVEEEKIYINVSIGVSMYPRDGENSADLIKNAAMAMRRAKNAGKNKYIFFTRDMLEELRNKLHIEYGIRYGLIHREFVVFYQPKVRVRDKKTASMEALIRWKKDDRLISPGVFIPIAEESSLIDDICLYVMEETCLFLNMMRNQGVVVPVSVNVSPRLLRNVDFVDKVEDMLNRHRMQPELLEFEITETSAMSDVEHTLKVMYAIRKLGISFSIDDFGTGYSSLAYLSRMPVSTLKIDKKFVDDLEENPGLIKTMIAIGREMRLVVVAEGVETEKQLLALTDMGCDEIQGYYFSRPLPEEETLHYLLKEKSLP